MKSQIQEIYNEIIENDLIEDRMEYGIEDLMSSYQIDNESAKSLFDMIHRKYLSLSDCPSEMIKEMILESLHQGLDGWNEEESKIIDDYISDILLAINSI